MKLKVLALVCMMTIGAWLVCVGLVGKDKLEVARLDEDCRDYIQRALPDITQHWSYGEWKLRATAELLVYTDDAKFRRDLRRYRAMFGEFKAFRSINGNVMIDVEEDRKLPIGAYTCRVIFEKGEADLAMKLVKKNGNWRFQTFSIRSEAVPDEPLR